MKIIISPAKSLNFEKDLPTNSFSLPVFIEDSKIINENLSVRDAENLAKDKKGIIKKLKLKDPDTIDLENKISEKLGLAININHKGKKGGSIKIDYKTLDQLEMITQKLKN